MNKRSYYILIIIILILIISIGYAYLSTNLSISGTSVINNPTWNIHFENIVPTTGSVTPTTAPTIGNDGLTVSYGVILSQPGDFYEFTIDAKNGGTIKAEVETITSKLNGTVITTLPSYLNYYVKNSNGTNIATGQTINGGSKATYKIRIEFKSDINASDLPITNQSLNLNFQITYKQSFN